MKKLLLLSIFFTAISTQAQVTIYDSTHAGLNGAEITPTANGSNCSFGDAVKLASTERLLDIISVDLFNLTDTSPVTLTMSLYTDCPTTTGAGVCGSGIGTMFPFSELAVVIDAPPTTGKFTVDFEFNGLDITEADNTITVMLKASRNNVFWVINETAVIGIQPDGDTALSTVTRCGSTGTNNGCGRVFTAPTINNVAMKITANPGLSTSTFTADSFVVFPNPIDNLISVKNDNNIVINSIVINDINGRIVKSQSFENLPNVQMNVADLASGMYMMKINSDKGLVTKKIIKN
ncbi:T9SS type A sorting domain-containing protein [Flavobacterium sp.]|uniref:T9SS type A sorting domain-containing protein n=1 Tax=Flavobacterium sp. TaxID=239 RepID=UPI00286ADB44|nr:T9SS type A sorting domain-containing protein [Flavobacterium sp.]